ncbi:MAG TPA: TIM-barrel domain-containing protein, partial [Dongiaceae bacterium]|nr:TIM-barrel domain-containing protein [Dongiaceae bacterium]
MGFAGLGLLAFGAQAAVDKVSPTQSGVMVQLGTAQVELAAASPEILRLSVRYDSQTGPIPSSFLSQTNQAAGTGKIIEADGWVGIKTKAGKLLLDPRTGEWTLLGTDDVTLIPKGKIGELDHSVSAKHQQIRIRLGWNPQKPVAVYGCGNGVPNLVQTAAHTGVSDGGATIPYYWSPAGYAVLAVTADDNQSASWRAAGNREAVTWTFPGSRADLYLMPAATLQDAAKAYARLTGFAPVPPRWTFGYLQSRWGWTNRQDVAAALDRFHELNIPVDAFIFDFEWYTRKPDYELADAGEAGFADFGWNPQLFPDLREEIKELKARDVRFVGIRKPRLGDAQLLQMVRSNRWDLRSQGYKNVPARDLDFLNADLREWYIKSSAGLYDAGVAAWWNDEGEATYTTYYYWNLAERAALDRYRPNARLWTLNRAFSPGTQRFGAAAWTGDINSSWETLAATPANLLNWSLSGMP